MTGYRSESTDYKIENKFFKKKWRKSLHSPKKSSNFATQKGNRELESRLQTERFNLRKDRIPEAKSVD